MDNKVYLFITPYFPTPESWRCAFGYDQAAAIQRTGRYRVVVINTNFNDDYDYQGIPVFGMKFARSGSSFAPGLFDAINFKRLHGCLQRADISYSDIAVAHAHLIPNAALAIKLRNRNAQIKTLVQFHDPDPYGAALCSSRHSLFGLKRILTYWRFRRAAERVNACVSISENVTKVALEFPRPSVYTTYVPMRRAMDEIGWMRPARLKRVILLHNGVDTTRFYPADTPKNARPRFVIGTIGNMIDWKSQITLFQALAEIKDKLGEWSIRVIGSGDQKDACVDAINKGGIQKHVCWEAEVRHEQLPDFYRSLDLFVLPSFFEGFGCVFTEAWSCGTPFITCEGQGMDDYISPMDRCQWFCQQQNPKDLADKILSFYERRPVQKLVAETDIDVLVPRFLDEVEKI